MNRTGFHTVIPGHDTQVSRDATIAAESCNTQLCPAPLSRHPICHTENAYVFSFTPPSWPLYRRYFLRHHSPEPRGNPRDTAAGAGLPNRRYRRDPRWLASGPDTEPLVGILSLGKARAGSAAPTGPRRSRANRERHSGLLSRARFRRNPNSSSRPLSGDGAAYPPFPSSSVLSRGKRENHGFLAHFSRIRHEASARGRA